MSQTGNGSSIETVLAETRRAWTRLLAAIDAADPASATEPGVCGDWSLVQTIGHVSFWDDFEIGRVQNREEYGDVDWQKLNDENAAAMAARSLGEARADLVANHERLWQVVTNGADLDPNQLRELMYDHYVEHGGEIERWNARISG